MQLQRLPMRDFLAHLRRHPMPEIMDDECLAALANVEAQYGDTLTYLGGLEVRLGEGARYVDYIMSIDTDEIPGVQSLWHEIDYAEFARGGHIEPCLFANTDTKKNAEELAKYWDDILPPFLGEKRAKTLRAPLDRLVAALPKGARVKQIGTMTSRGELDIMRIVIMFPAWEMVTAALAAIGWKGDGAALDAAMQPWKETKSIAVDLDLGVDGVLPKIGIEIFPRWRHPLLVDKKFIARFENAGLCLPSKGEALRRWIRIRPDGDPFIQTLVVYCKLNYRDGKIFEAKAYLEQSPYIHHRFFDAYELPTRMDMEVKNAAHTLSEEVAMKRLRECGEKKIRRVRFLGDVAAYEPLSRLLGQCKESGIATTVVLPADAMAPARMEAIVACGADAYIAELAESGAPTEAVSALCRAGLGDKTAARWAVTENNAARVAEVTETLEALGLRELIVTGGTPGTPLPSRERLEAVGKFLQARQADDTDEATEDEAKDTAQKKMTLTVETCFSPLRAWLGGKDPSRNDNRGIIQGCEAGRSFVAVRADGNLAPCIRLPADGERGPIAAYWNSPKLDPLRERGNKKTCGNCAYRRRCRPCPAATETIKKCPLAMRV